MILIKKYYPTVFLLAACFVLFPVLSPAQTATFDNLSEGAVGSEITDGGITFYDLDNGQPGLDQVFIIEQADGTLSGSDFSGPNGLTATSMTPGTEAGFGAVKEIFMTADEDADSASIQVFTTGTLLYGNTITLEALKDGVVVASDEVLVSDIIDGHATLQIAGTIFDTLRLVSSPNSQALLLDNVTINGMDSCPCDIVNDGVCDMSDWQLFVQDWGMTDCHDPGGHTCACDITEDGVCDMSDWQLFVQDWGRADCPYQPQPE